MTTARAYAPEDEEVLSLHNEIEEKYLELLKKWEPELPAEELPAMISTYDVASPESISGYKMLVATVLIDEVNEERIAGLINLVTKLLRRQVADHGRQ